ncbi:MAG TPA: acyl-CoA desaturase [Kofleriaceae bacterium]
MNQQKADLLDRFESPKVLYGPSRTTASKSALATVKHDPRMRQLRDDLRTVGFFEPAQLRYAIRLVVIIAGIAAGWLVLLLADGWAWRLGAAAAIGFTVVQSAFFAHEAAHCAIRLNATKVELLGQLTDTFIIGYSFAYFRRSHDLHHFHTNEVDKDPDGLSALFSVHAWSARQKTGWLGVMMSRWQGLLLPIFYALWAFTMKWDGITYVLRNWRRASLDLAMLVLHVAFWLVLPAYFLGIGVTLLNYVLWNVVAGWYLASIIPVNHVGMEPIERGDDVDFVTQQVRSSRNIVEPSWLPGGAWLYDMFFIGLNRQIEHHLFPYVATPRLRRGQAVVKAFCQRHGLPYGEWRYLSAMTEAHKHLWRVGRLASFNPVIEQRHQLEERARFDREGLEEPHDSRKHLVGLT